jgi:hypothetical protein
MTTQPQCSGIDSGIPCAMREGHDGFCMSHRLMEHEAARLRFVNIMLEAQKSHQAEFARVVWERS